MQQRKRERFTQVLHDLAAWWAPNSKTISASCLSLHSYVDREEWTSLLSNYLASFHCAGVLFTHLSSFWSPWCKNLPLHHLGHWGRLLESPDCLWQWGEGSSRTHHQEAWRCHRLSSPPSAGHAHLVHPLTSSAQHLLTHTSEEAGQEGAPTDGCLGEHFASTS